jgi:alkylation response protein AidB-like acyl-CoA dehydrogenase
MRMDFELTQEQTMFRDIAHKLQSRRYFRISDYEREEVFEGSWKRQKRLLSGLISTENMAGWGSPLDVAIILEELCWASYGSPQFLEGRSFPARHFDGGNDEQRQASEVPGSCLPAGRRVEPNASDASNIETSAVKTEHVVINGQVLSPMRQIDMAPAQTDKSRGPKG